MLLDFIPRTQQDRLQLAIYEQLVELNKKLESLIPKQEEVTEKPVEIKTDKPEVKKRTRKKEVVNNV